MLEVIRNYAGHLKLKYRRWRVERAYSKLAAARDGMDGALSGIMYTWGLMESDGIISFRDPPGDDPPEIIWHWPQDWPPEDADGGPDG